MTAVVIVVLAAWVLVAVLNHVTGPWTRLFGAFNGFSLFPRLDFFAPDPLDVDYHLVVRDVEPEGPWRRVAIDRDGPLKMLWSPAKRDHQALLAAVADLAGLQQCVAPVVRDADAVIQVSLPYLFLLHAALQAPSAARVGQFMIVESAGFGEARQVALGILSGPHQR
jgi:hypothetical protein